MRQYTRATVTTTTPEQDLPLRWRTPPTWADEVLREPLRLLNDHAHLEKKAATNALELLNRWPEPNPPENWVRAMTAIARDEVEHLAIVTRLLARRGGRLTKSHRSAYASALRGLVRADDPAHELVDRLLLSALIEARSCERFFLLAGACADRELAELYRELYASEAGHYLTFLGLAEQLPGHQDVLHRWDELLDAEAGIIVRQPIGPTIHGGVGRTAVTSPRAAR